MSDKTRDTLDWRKQYHDEVVGVVTASSGDPDQPGWYVLDDLSQGCWIAYFEPDDGSSAISRTRVELHRGSMSRCAAACENHAHSNVTTR